MRQITAATLGDAHFSQPFAAIGVVTVLVVACSGELAGRSPSPDAAAL